MNQAQTFNAFWNSFREGDNWKAYDASSVPDNTPDKRITYELSIDEFDHPVALTANLWDRSTSWMAITNKEMEISDYISRGGLMIRCDNGALWIKKAHPWAQRLTDDEDIKRIVLNIVVEFIN